MVASKPKSLRERIETILIEMKIPLSEYDKLMSMVKILGGGAKSDETLKDFIVNAYKAMTE